MEMHKSKLKEGSRMPIVEEFTQMLQNIWGWFGSFADIGDMFVQLWNGFINFFSTVFNGIVGLFG